MDFSVLFVYFTAGTRFERLGRPAGDRRVTKIVQRRHSDGPVSIRGVFLIFFFLRLRHEPDTAEMNDSGMDGSGRFAMLRFVLREDGSVSPKTRAGPNGFLIFFSKSPTPTPTRTMAKNGGAVRSSRNHDSVTGPGYFVIGTDGDGDGDDDDDVRGGGGRATSDNNIVIAARACATAFPAARARVHVNRG